MATLSIGADLWGEWRGGYFKLLRMTSIPDWFIWFWGGWVRWGDGPGGYSGSSRCPASQTGSFGFEGDGWGGVSGGEAIQALQDDLHPRLGSFGFEGCSARDWEWYGLLEENPQSGLVEIRAWQRATIGVLPTYATRWNSGMKRVKCGWTQPFIPLHKMSAP